jgi:hypothetical protein
MFGLWTPVVLWMAAIFYVSSMSDAAPPAGMSDVSMHGAAYCLLSMLVVRALAGGLPARIGWRLALTAIAISAVYGGTDEFHQSFVVNRAAELRDLYADAIGAAIGAAACWAWGIIAPRPALSRAPRHDL